MNFKELCDSITDIACIISVRKTGSGYDEIRIVEGNKKHRASFNTENDFVPNSIYTKYLPRNLNFEEYCYRSAVKKELLHSYAYPEYLKSWLHMLYIPLEYEDNNISYCLYIMEMNSIFNPENLTNASSDIDNKVLRTTLQLAKTSDFDVSLKNVTREIRKICNATFCCILLFNDDKHLLKVLAEDRDLESDRLTMNEYMDNTFYDIVKSWDKTISDSDCIIVNDEKGMDYIKDVNEMWYESLTSNGIDSLVLFRLKSNDNQIGYMWVTNFETTNTPKIKETLEITTFILGFEIGNHLLVDQLTQLSSFDVLTGLYNRNKMNSYMNEIAETNDSISLIFLDINGLKKINDIEGHEAGDNLIKTAANILKTVFKDSYIFRAGGDEFVVILKNVNEKQIKYYINDLEEQSLKNNVSFAYGYSRTNNPQEIERILKKADSNMYINKRNYYQHNS